MDWQNCSQNAQGHMLFHPPGSGDGDANGNLAMGGIFLGGALHEMVGFEFLLPTKTEELRTTSIQLLKLN